MADLMTQLLKADVAKTEERATGTFESKNLGKLLGKESETIHIREISPREFQGIRDMGTNKDGSRNPSKDFESTGMICVKGITDPCLTEKELKEHFGVSFAHELAWKLFKMETPAIADRILKLSGILEEDEGDTLKNL